MSIHGISLDASFCSKNKGGTTCALAVGDTFLFSPLSTGTIAEGIPGITSEFMSSSSNNNNSDISSNTKGGMDIFPTISDGYCMTHVVPYYRCILGGGIEEKSAQRLLGCIKSPHM